jgi:hypothetical protein
VDALYVQGQKDENVGRKDESAYSGCKSNKLTRISEKRRRLFFWERFSPVCVHFQLLFCKKASLVNLYGLFPDSSLDKMNQTNKRSVLTVPDIKTTVFAGKATVFGEQIIRKKNKNTVFSFLRQKQMTVCFCRRWQERMNGCRGTGCRNRTAMAGCKILRFCGRRPSVRDLSLPPNHPLPSFHHASK